MRRQLPCSKCGSAYSSTSKSANASKPVVCNACSAKGRKSKKPVINPIPTPKQGIDYGTISNNSMDENVTLTINQIGMELGKLSFQPNTTLPMTPKLSKFIFGDSMGYQDDLYYGTTLKSLLGQDEIQISQDKYDYEDTSQEATTKTPSLWDPKKLQKRWRSKLNNATCDDQIHTKYDDVFIYEKCKFVGENEIGLGAMLL